MDQSRKKLSDRIKAARGELDLSQGAFAEKARISLRGLQDIEYEKTDDPKVSTIWGISNATGISIDMLIKGNEIPSPGSIELNRTANFLLKLAKLRSDPQKLVFALVLGDVSFLDGLPEKTRHLLEQLFESLGIKP